MNTFPISNITATSVTLNSSMQHVWNMITIPEHIINFIPNTTDYLVLPVENELVQGGAFKFTFLPAQLNVPALDFKFEGIYSSVKTFERISFSFSNGVLYHLHLTEVEGKG